MRVLLVALADQLEALSSMLNLELKICAVVADEPELAQSIAKRYDIRSEEFFPYYQLKECIESTNFDYAIVCARRGLSERMIDDLLDFNVSADKIINLRDIEKPSSIDHLTKLLNHYNRNFNRYKMFVTGISTVCCAIDLREFELPTINFACGSQDIYYDFKLADNAINVKNSTGGGIKCALIGLVPYSFQYDASKSVKAGWRMLQWYLGLRDLHNFPIAEEEYRAFFKKEFLDGGFMKPTEINLNDVYGWKQEKMMTPNEQIGIRPRAEVWKDKFYPDTLEENKKIFDAYLTLCEQKNIKSIVFTAPVSKGYRYCFPKNRLEEFHAVRNEIMNRHPTSVFFDGWKVDGLTDADFFDTDHINIFGAAKFSAALNDFIMKLERK